MLKVKTIEAAIYQYRGNVTKVAESLGVRRTTISNRVVKSDTLKKALDTARNQRNDAVKDVLYEAAVLDKNITAAIFIAKTRMGWRETNITKHTGKIIMSWADDDGDND